MAPSQGKTEVGIGQQARLARAPELRAHFDVPIGLPRLEFVLDPVAERSPLPDQAFVTDVDDGVRPQGRRRRRHQEIDPRRPEGFDDRRKLRRADRADPGDPRRLLQGDGPAHIAPDIAFG